MNDSQPMKVLMVEDEEELAHNLCDVLTSILGPNNPDGPGWDIDFSLVGNQEDADRILIASDADFFDLVLLDLSYPASASSKNFNLRQGMNWLPELRRHLPRATIIIVSAFVEELEISELVDAVRRGLVDDFVSKLAGEREIATRIQVACENSRHRHQAVAIAKDYYSILRSLSLRVYAEDVGQQLEVTLRELERTASKIESNDPSVVESAPERVRTSIRDMRTKFKDISSILLHRKESLQKANITRIINEVLLLYQYQADEVGAQFTAPPKNIRLFLTTYISDVKLAIHEVVRNALDAVSTREKRCDDRPRIIVTIEKIKDGAKIVVQDNGDGFLPEIQKDLFKPGTTGHPEDSTSMGIGLHVTRRMLQAIGGDIICDNLQNGAGAQVSLWVRNLT